MLGVFVTSLTVQIQKSGFCLGFLDLKKNTVNKHMYLSFDQRAVWTLANEKNTRASRRAGDLTYF